MTRTKQAPKKAPKRSAPRKAAAKKAAAKKAAPKKAAPKKAAAKKAAAKKAAPKKAAPKGATGKTAAPNRRPAKAAPARTAAPDGVSDAELKHMGASKVSQQLMSIVQRYPDHSDTNDARRVALERALRLAERTAVLTGADDGLVMLRSMTLSKLGRFAEAVQAARELHAKAPTWNSACAVANALRRAGDSEGAAAMFLEAAALDPADVAALLDAGDLHLEAQRWASGLDAYQVALQREPGQDWAAPSACYCEYRRSGDERFLKRLQAMAAAEPDPCGIQDFLTHAFGGYSSEDRRRRAAELLERCTPV